MNFIFPWPLLQRKNKAKREQLAKMAQELGNDEVIAELVERDPKVREALHALEV